MELIGIAFPGKHPGQALDCASRLNGDDHPLTFL